MFELFLAITFLIMQGSPQFEQTLITHACPRTICEQYLRILFISIAKYEFIILFISFGEEGFQRFCIKFDMFKLSMTIITPIMQMAPPFVQILTRHTQGLFVCNI